MIMLKRLVWFHVGVWTFKLFVTYHRDVVSWFRDPHAQRWLFAARRGRYLRRLGRFDDLHYRRLLLLLIIFLINRLSWQDVAVLGHYGQMVAFFYFVLNYFFIDKMLLRAFVTLLLFR